MFSLLFPLLTQVVICLFSCTTLGGRMTTPQSRVSFVSCCSRWRDQSSEAEGLCVCMTSHQTTWPAFSWQGTGCSGSKTYTSKILPLRFPSFFLSSAPPPPAQLPSILIFLPHCLPVAEGRQGLQAASLKWQIGVDAPSGTGTLALSARGSSRIGAGGGGERRLSPCPESCPWLWQQRPSWVSRKMLPSPTQVYRTGFCFSRAAGRWFSSLALLEILLRGVGNVASSFFSPGDLLVSPHPPSVCPPGAPRATGSPRLRKTAAPGVSFHALKSGNLGSRNTSWSFCWKGKE